MRRFTRIFAVAACAAAIVVIGCGDPTGNTGKAPVCEIGPYANGAYVNESAKANTPVPINVVCSAGDKVIDASASVNGRSVPVGSYQELHFGSNAICASATANGQNTAPCVTWNVRLDGELIRDFAIASPTAGMRVRVGEKIECKHSAFDPRGNISRVDWSLDTGVPATCSPEYGLIIGNDGGVLAQGQNFALGTHKVHARGHGPNGTVFNAEPVEFEVLPALGYIVFSNTVGSITAFGKTGDDNEFWTAREDGTDLRRLVPSNGIIKDWPIISPDGQRLAYSAYTDQNCVETYVSQLNGTNAVKVSGDSCASGSSIAPYWSPDGSRLMYSGSVDGLRAPYIVNTDGSGRRPIPALTCNTARSNAPCFEYLQSEMQFMPNGYEVVMVLYEVASTSPTMTRGVVVKWNLNTDQYVRVWEDASYQSGNDFSPRLSHVHPSGEWVVGVGHSSGQIILISLTSPGVGRILPGSVSDRAWWPYFCEGGAWICYGPGENSRAIRRMDMDGQNDQEVFRLSGSPTSGIRIMTTMRPHPLY